MDLHGIHFPAGAPSPFSLLFQALLEPRAIDGETGFLCVVEREVKGEAVGVVQGKRLVSRELAPPFRPRAGDVLLEQLHSRVEAREEALLLFAHDLLDEAGLLPHLRIHIPMISPTIGASS